MAAIGRIRKHGVALMIIIGIALLAFIVGDLTQIIPSITNRNLLAKIGNETIRMDGRENHYTTYYEQNRALVSYLNNISGTDEEFDQYIHNMTWQQIKTEAILDKELKKLGFTFHNEMVENINSELIASLNSQPQTYAQQYLRALSQRLLQNSNNSIAALIDAYTNINDYRGYDIYNLYKAIERQAILETKDMIYYNLMGSFLFFSTPLKQQIGAEGTATLQYAFINPNDQAFKDIEVNVDESEAKAFFKKHQNRYFVKENLRDIDFAIFPIVPTVQDRKDIEDSVQMMYQRLVEAPSIASFVKGERKIEKSRRFSTDEGSFWIYNDQIANHVQIDTLMYLAHGKSALQTYQVNQDPTYDLPAHLDSLIFHSPVGTMIPPYLDGNFWYFGKVRDIAYRPDSILTSFLTIDFKIGQSTSTRTKEEAKALADSLQQVMQQGTSIFTLLPSYKNERVFGADSTYWFTDVPDTLFNKLMLTPGGQFYVHEATDCYLVFQVLAKSQLLEKRQYVLYPVPVEPSKNTIEDLRIAANALAAECESVEKLNELAQSKGAMLISQNDITNMQGIIGTGMQENLMCREAISWAFDKDTELGSVSRAAFNGRFFYSGYNQPKQLGTQVYVVAGLKRIKNAGKGEFVNVKDAIIEELTTEKKIAKAEEMLNQELAKTSVTDLCKKNNWPLHDSTTINMTQIRPMGIENIAVGKIATMKADGKPTVVTGKNTLYIVSIYNFTPGTPTANLNSENNSLREIVIGRGVTEQTLAWDDLQRKVKIDDRRHNFYKSSN